MQITSSSKTITVKMPVEHYKMRGKKTGKVSCRIGGYDGFEIVANSVDELSDMATKFLKRSADSPQLALVRVGNEYRILQGSAHGVSVFRQHEPNPADGVVLLYNVCSSSDEDVLIEAKSQIVHLAQQLWSETGQISPAIPESHFADFMSWVDWQERYRSAIADGNSDNDAHRIACQLV